MATTGNQTGFVLNCPAPFVSEALQTGRGLVDEQFCFVTCCARCPAILLVYPDKLFTWLFASGIIFIIGGALNLYNLISMIVLPRSITHVTSLRLTTTFALTLAGLDQTLTIGSDRNKYFCEDPLTSSNSGRCAVQGGILLYATLQLITSVVLRILTLWFPIVLKRDLGRFVKLSLTLFCWIAPLFPVAIAAASKQLGYNSSLLYCTTGWKNALGYFMIPIFIFGAIAGVLQITLFGMSAWTYYKANLEHPHAGSSHGQNSFSISSVGNSQTTANRRLKTRRFIKLQLMAATPFFLYALGLLFAISVLYTLRESAIYNNGYPIEVVNWVTCIIQNGSEACPPSFYPSMYLIAISQLVLSICVTILFFTMFRVQTLKGWKELFAGLFYSLSGSSSKDDWGNDKNDEKEHNSYANGIQNISSPYGVKHHGDSFEEREVSDYPRKSIGTHSTPRSPEPTYNQYAHNGRDTSRARSNSQGTQYSQKGSQYGGSQYADAQQRGRTSYDRSERSDVPPNAYNSSVNRNLSVASSSNHTHNTYGTSNTYHNRQASWQKTPQMDYYDNNQRTSYNDRRDTRETNNSGSGMQGRTSLRTKSSWGDGPNQGLQSLTSWADNSPSNVKRKPSWSETPPLQFTKSGELKPQHNERR